MAGAPPQFYPIVQQPSSNAQFGQSQPPGMYAQPQTPGAGMYAQPQPGMYGAQPQPGMYAQPQPGMYAQPQPPGMYGQAQNYQNPNQFQPQIGITPGYPMPQQSQQFPMIVPLTGVDGVSPGLELLLPLNFVFIKQQIEPLEMIARIETPNKYAVMNPQGQRIYFASEVADIATFYGGSSRPFTMHIFDFSGRIVLILYRPFEMCAGGRLEVHLPDGALLGEIVQLGMCTPEFDISDGSGVVILKITGPAGGDCCSGGADYPIKTTAGVDVGIIRKTFAGFVQEAYTDADNFGVEFPPDLDVKWKALMFAAVFLIDFIYFEHTPNRHHHHHHGIGHRHSF